MCLMEVFVKSRCRRSAGLSCSNCSATVVDCSRGGLGWLPAVECKAELLGLKPHAWDKMSQNSLITSGNFPGELGLCVSMFSEGWHKHTVCQFYIQLSFFYPPPPTGILVFTFSCRREFGVVCSWSGWLLLRKEWVMHVGITYCHQFEKSPNPILS